VKRPSAPAAATASAIARPRSRAGARLSSIEASTAPPRATAAPASAIPDGRSPVASEIANGTTAPHATTGETMLIVPSASAR
jgi:hypothetical protein